MEKVEYIQCIYYIVDDIHTTRVYDLHIVSSVKYSRFNELRWTRNVLRPKKKYVSNRLRVASRHKAK